MWVTVSGKTNATKQKLENQNQTSELAAKKTKFKKYAVFWKLIDVATISHYLDVRFFPGIKEEIAHLPQILQLWVHSATVYQWCTKATLLNQIYSVYVGLSCQFD